MTPGQRAEAEADVSAVYQMAHALHKVDPSLMTRLARNLRAALDHNAQLQRQLEAARTELAAHLAKAVTR